MITHRVHRGYVEVSCLVPLENLHTAVVQGSGRRVSSGLVEADLGTKLSLVLRGTNNGEVGGRQEFLLDFLQVGHIWGRLRERGR